MRLLVCGGAGFIGSNFVRRRLHASDDEVVVLDKLTYAGRRENFHDIEADPRFSFVHGAIEDAAAVAGAIEGVGAVVNFAAETHVDRSIAGASDFVASNVAGVQVVKAFAGAGTDGGDPDSHWIKSIGGWAAGGAKRVRLDGRSPCYSERGRSARTRAIARWRHGVIG